jgi:hypothetical protein
VEASPARGASSNPGRTTDCPGATGYVDAAGSRTTGQTASRRQRSGTEPRTAATIGLRPLSPARESPPRGPLPAWCTADSGPSRGARPANPPSAWTNRIAGLRPSWMRSCANDREDLLGGLGISMHVGIDLFILIAATSPSFPLKWPADASSPSATGSSKDGWTAVTRLSRPGASRPAPPGSTPQASHAGYDKRRRRPERLLLHEGRDSRRICGPRL